MKGEGKRRGHPSLIGLIEFLEGDMPGVESRLVEQHLAGGCGGCAADLRWLVGTLGLLADGPYFEPPAAVVTDAIDHFARRPARRRPPPAWLSRLQPVLTVVSLALLCLTITLLIRFQPARPALAQASGSVRVEEAADLPTLNLATLRAGAAVHTGQDSQAGLSFPDGSQMWLAAETDLTVLQADFDPQRRSRILLRQASGDTYHRVAVGGPYAVETPAGRIEVTGSVFRLTVLSNGAIVVRVEQGQARLIGAAGERVVNAGESAVLRPAAATARNWARFSFSLL
ncbi:MAG: FecR domain-containing protein [Candidatus Promineifilaceae bacterium]